MKNGNPMATVLLKQIGFENISLSTITLMELFYGALNKRELLKIKKHMQDLEILHINKETDEIAVELIEKYSKSHGLRIPDALIAATAIQRKLPLFSFNIKDFKYIDRLSLYHE